MVYIYRWSMRVQGIVLQYGGSVLKRVSKVNWLYQVEIIWTIFH